MIIPVAAVLAVLAPVLTGGRLRRFAALRIRHGWVLGLALLAQVVVLEVTPDGHRTVLAAVHVVTYLAAGWFVWANRSVPGLLLIGLGAASNGLAITLNGGTLPADPDALATAGVDLDPDAFVNSGVLAAPRLAFLGDVFAIPAGWPLANVFSIGDVLIVAGVAWCAHRVCGSRLVPAWRPDGAPGDGELRSDGDPVDTLGTDAGSSRTQPWGAT